MTVKPTNKTSRPVMRFLKRLNILSMVGISFLLSMVVFGALLALFSVFIRSSGGSLAISGWDLLEGFTSLLTLAVLAGGGLFALTEYIEAEESRREQAALTAFNLYQNIFDKMTNPEAINARRWILHNIPERAEGQSREEWCEQVGAVIFAADENGEIEGQAHLKEVLNTYDFLGFVARYYWEVDEALLNWMSPMVAKVWTQLGDYIEYQAEIRDEPDYYEDARYLGTLCIEWRRKQGLEARIVKGAL